MVAKPLKRLTRWFRRNAAWIVALCAAAEVLWLLSFKRSESSQRIWLGIIFVCAVGAIVLGLVLPDKRDENSKKKQRR